MPGRWDVLRHNTTEKLRPLQLISSWSTIAHTKRQKSDLNIKTEFCPEIWLTQIASTAKILCIIFHFLQEPFRMGFQHSRRRWRFLRFWRKVTVSKFSGGLWKGLIVLLGLEISGKIKVGVHEPLSCYLADMEHCPFMNITPSVYFLLSLLVSWNCLRLSCSEQVLKGTEIPWEGEMGGS